LIKTVYGKKYNGISWSTFQYGEHLKKNKKQIRPISSLVSLLYTTFVASEINDSSEVSNLAPLLLISSTNNTFVPTLNWHQGQWTMQARNDSLCQMYIYSMNKSISF
jgi:hypothetical protein